MTTFDKFVPSVFVVTSPFQALCAIAAIRQLEITDYKMFLYVPRSDPRNSQTIKLLKDNDIEYTLYKTYSFLNTFLNYRFKLGAICRRKNHYLRLFVGDFRNYMQLYIGANYVSNSSSLIYLDDGNVTIALLKDQITNPLSGLNKLLFTIISKYRNITPFKNMMTIYDDIPNTKYHISPLNLSYAIRGKKNKSSEGGKGVFVVGTNIKLYCLAMQYKYDDYVNKLDEIMYRLRLEYPKEPVIYIPHGRDTSEDAQDICHRYGCEFRKLDVMVEIELLRLSYSPLAVYGFTSSALYTLKKLYPDIKVVNILFDGDKNNGYYKEYLVTSKYYERNGIELIKESLKSHSLKRPTD